MERRSATLGGVQRLPPDLRVVPARRVVDVKVTWDLVAVLTMVHNHNLDIRSSVLIIGTSRYRAIGLIPGAIWIPRIDDVVASPTWTAIVGGAAQVRPDGSGINARFHAWDPGVVAGKTAVCVANTLLTGGFKVLSSIAFLISWWCIGGFGNGSCCKGGVGRKEKGSYEREGMHSE